MKKMFAVLCVLLILTTTLFAQGQAESGKQLLKVGMVTDAGTIDDKSFNQDSRI